MGYNRKDAKRKKMSSMMQIMVDLKPRRCDSDVYINQKLDVTELAKYFEKKKKENEDLTYFHLFVTAIAKVIYHRNRLNMFIANRHLYEHNDLVISFVAKESFEDNSEEIMVMIPINKDDNCDSISKKIKDKVDGLRNKKVSKEGANSAIDTLSKLPNFIRIPTIGFFKWCDSKGILPSSLVKDNLYYSSMIVSNLGTLKCGAIYHNITNFGTCSSLATIGEIKEEKVYINGKIENRKMCEFGINIDERIADGFYFIKCLHLIQYIFDNPDILDEKIEDKVNEDI